MDKKELKFYEAPACDVVELKVASMLCSSPSQDSGQETPGGEDE